jgi:hypothetical protein
MEPEMFNGPIPGESLTQPPGNTPWEKPPKYAKVEEALSFYMDKFEDPQKLEDFLFLLSNDAPLDLMVDNLLGMGEMNGLHTADTSLLVGPILHEYLKLMADAAGVEYREFQGKTPEEKAEEKKKSDFNLVLGRELDKKRKM